MFGLCPNDGFPNKSIDKNYELRYNSICIASDRYGNSIIERHNEMKKITCMFLIILVLAATSVFSQTITISGNAPTVTGDPGGINTELNNAFNGLKDQLGEQIGSLNIAPENLIRAFGNSSVYASQGGATQRGYSGYKSFAFTFGPSVGLQIPVSPFEIMDLINGNPNGDPLKDIFGDIFETGDMTFGLNPQVINAQIGFNTSFLMKNLYLGLRVGFTPDIGKIEGLGELMGDMGGMKLSFSNFMIGVTANYQLIDSVKILGLITWRGINVGSGFIFQNTKLGITYPVGDFEQQLGGSHTNLSLKANPELYFNANITTFTIPLEIMTAINLIFINIPIGVGVDFAFGESAMNIGMRSDIDIVGTYSNPINPGNLTIDAGGAVGPQFANLKLMSGIGIALGPVIIDIPVTWYFKDNGLNVGFTFGVVY